MNSQNTLCNPQTCPVYFMEYQSPGLQERLPFSLFLSLDCACSMKAKIFPWAHCVWAFSSLSWTLHLHGNMRDCHWNYKNGLENHIDALLVVESVHENMNVNAWIAEDVSHCTNCIYYSIHVKLFLWLGDKKCFSSNDIRNYNVKGWVHCFPSLTLWRYFF